MPQRVSNTTADMQQTDNAASFLADAMTSANPSDAIVAMEKRGQQELVSSTQLPTDGSDNPEILAMGITFGDVTPGDELFREATLPEGWHKEGSDHDMWSYVVDDKGVRRISVFYKAVFYDRRAFMQPERS